MRCTNQRQWGREQGCIYDLLQAEIESTPCHEINIATWMRKWKTTTQITIDDGKERMWQHEKQLREATWILHGIGSGYWREFQALADTEKRTPPGTSDINTIRLAYTQPCKACLGCRQKKRKEWITADTWQTIKSMSALMKKVMDTRSERLTERYRQQCWEADQTLKRMTRAYILRHVEFHNRSSLSSWASTTT